MAAVSLRGVKKVFAANKTENVQVLSGIDVDVEEGEFLAILGASGCGKSTLLRIISGLESLSDGSVEIQAQDVTAVPPEKRNLAMVFQNYALFPHLNVEENLVFGLKARRVDSTVRKERLAETAELLGLDELLERKPAELSGGQRQRVALGRALVSGQRLVLMDEPLSNLDAKLRSEMRTELKRVQRALDLTIIYVTHDQVEAMTMADRVMMLSEGRIEQLASPQELYRAPATTTVGRFIGSPPMNILDLPTDSELVLLHGPREAGGVSLGVRPEKLEIHGPGEEIPSSRIRLGEATVLVNELLGADRVITAVLDEHVVDEGASRRVIARADPGQQVEMDQKVLLSAEPGAIHWYSRETGRLVYDRAKITEKSSIA